MEVINVKVGEIKVTKRDVILKSLLGSCVGIAILDKTNQKYGLAHCLLSHAPSSEKFSVGAKYVDQAVKSLFKLMKIDDGNLHQIEAVIAGGASLNASLEMNKDINIGKKNVNAAYQTLAKHGAKILVSEVGGKQARTIEVNCKTGSCEIKKIRNFAEKESA